MSEACLDYRRLPHPPRDRQGRRKGPWRTCHPQHLGATVLKAIAERNRPQHGGSRRHHLGHQSQRGLQGGDLGRMAALDAGYDIRSSAVTLDRFCGSGITSVNLAAAHHHVGHGRPGTIGGGTEMMSHYGQDGQTSRHVYRQ